MAETSRTEIDALARARTVQLETRKRDGSWVATPVSLVRDGDRWFFRTYDQSGKAKRLRNFDEVRVTPCSMWGKVTSGTAVGGRAELLDGFDALRARRALASKFPVLHRVAVPTMHRLRGWVTLHYELHPDA